MQQAQATKAVAFVTVVGEIGKKQPFGVADDDRADVPATVDERADLAVDFEAQFGECPSEFRSDDCIRRDFAFGQFLETFQRGGLQASRIARDVYGDLLSP